VMGGADCSSVAAAMSLAGAEADVPLPILPDTGAQVHAQRELTSAGGGGTPPRLH
jgi:hypothetical protein